MGIELIHAQNLALLPLVLGLGALQGYLWGCWNGAVIVSKYILHDDVRNHGSGNAGLTNFYRTFGGGLTVAVMLTDALKALAAIWCGLWIAGALLPGAGTVGALISYWSGLFCLLGHMFPVMFRFRGGKGVLSGAAVLLMLDWRLTALVWGCFFVVVVASRYVSLASCTAAAAFPVGTWLFYQDGLLTLLGGVMGGLILFMHRGNIQRLLAGTEPRFSLNRTK